MAEGSIEAKVKQIIADELDVDESEVTPNARFIDDLGADSLDAVEKEKTTGAPRSSQTHREGGRANRDHRCFLAQASFTSCRRSTCPSLRVWSSNALSIFSPPPLGKSHVSQFFLYCALQESIEYLKQHAVGAVFDAIVVDTFKLIPFMVPDGKNDGSVAPMFRQVGNLLEQNQKLRAARDPFLPRLMSGEIAV